MEDASFCKDCKANTIVAFDHSNGDTICTQCGLVLEAHYIDEASEWRSFSNNEKQHDDPSRVGSASNIFSSHNNLTTFISKGKDTKNCYFPPRLQMQEANSQKALVEGIEVVDTMADRLGLSEAITKRGHQMFTQMEEQKCRTDKNQDALAAGCLFIAAREHNLPRTLKEICTASYGLSMKEVYKGVQLIRRQLGLDMGATDTTELVRRFCSSLGMKPPATRAVQEAVEKSEEFHIKRNPKSVLAAIICVVSQLSSSDDDKKPLEDISKACEVAEATIRKAFKEIVPYVPRLVPKWYASNEEDIANLCCPC